METYRKQRSHAMMIAILAIIAMFAVIQKIDHTMMENRKSESPAQLMENQ